MAQKTKLQMIWINPNHVRFEIVTQDTGTVREIVMDMHNDKRLPADQFQAQVDGAWDAAQELKRTFRTWRD